MITRVLLLWWYSCFGTVWSSDAIVTAYCPCEICCPGTADGFTATMTRAKHRGVAVDPRRIPYGSLLYVPGYGFALADDTGAAMRNDPDLHIDVRFRSHALAVRWGAKLEAIVWEPLTAPSTSGPRR